MQTYSMPEIIDSKLQPCSDLFGELVRGASVSLSPYDIRCKIAFLQERFLELKEEGLATPERLFPVKHHFVDHAYGREIFLPAGQVVIGRIHKYEHLNIISKGSVTVVTEDGGVEHLQAPCTMISPVGTKRCLVTHDDTVWTTFHVTDETDVDKIVNEIISVETYSELGMDEPDTTLASIEREALIDIQ